MLSDKVKNRIESSQILAASVNYERYGGDWEQFSRSAFESIAKKINQHVTERVLQNPELISECLIIGRDEIDSVFFRNRLSSLDEFLAFIEHQNTFKPFTWISGKTLHSYWHGGNPKDKKYNVLLTFLEVDVDQWDTWKNEIFEKERVLTSDHTNLNLLRRYYLGHYYRYYQKADGSPVMVKTPMIIREDVKKGVVVETKTLGHRYRSTYLAMRDGALYIDCENVDWNEKENHIYNIGFETNPQVITGISNTLDRRKRTIGLLNILVKQQFPFDYATEEGREYSFNHHFEEDSEEHRVLEFLKNNGCNILQSQYCYTLDELRDSQIRIN